MWVLINRKHLLNVPCGAQPWGRRRGGAEIPVPKVASHWVGRQAARAHCVSANGTRSPFFREVIPPLPFSPCASGRSDSSPTQGLNRSRSASHPALSTCCEILTGSVVTRSSHLPLRWKLEGQCPGSCWPSPYAQVRPQNEIDP